jgi:hypothetical protein
MARLLGPDAGSRSVFLPTGRPASGRVGTVYTAADGDTLASIAAYQAGDPDTPGSVISGSTLTVDAYGLLPLFWFPDGQDTVWITVNGGPLVEINANYDARLDVVNSPAVTVSYASSITLDAALGSVFRVTATGNLTLADITGGVDGQQVAVEVLASGGLRTVTVTDVDAFPVPSGTWWTAAFRHNAETSSWLMVGV